MRSVSMADRGPCDNRPKNVTASIRSSIAERGLHGEASKNSYCAAPPAPQDGRILDRGAGRGCGAGCAEGCCRPARNFGATQAPESPCEKKCTEKKKRKFQKKHISTRFVRRSR